MMKEGNTVTLTAVGDIMLGGNVEALIKQHGPGYPFQCVGDILKNSDIAFANLESPLTNESNKAIWDYTKILDHPIEINGRPIGSSIYCKASPHCVNALSLAGINIVSIANNHIMDYGLNGLSDTITELSKKNISSIGAGKNIAEAKKPVIIEKNGLKIGFLAYCDVYIASKKRAGTAPLKLAVQDIKSLKSEVDIIVVSVHQGQDISDYPRKSEVYSMHRLINAGAQIVLRHHPHVIQGIEKYKGGVIAYSLGNFICDYTIDPLWSELNKSRFGMIFRCTCSKKGIDSFDVTFTKLGLDFRPHILKTEADENIRLDAHFKKISKAIENDHIPNNTLTLSVLDQLSLALRLIIISFKKRKFKNILLLIQRVLSQGFEHISRIRGKL